MVKANQGRSAVEVGLTRQTLLRAAVASGLAGALPAESHAAGNVDALAEARAAGRLGPHAIKQIETAWITMSDGVKIAARIFLPADTDAQPAPAIMEYIPYRRRDGTRIDDDQRYNFFASHGYACIRPDMRGSGDSEGILKDEYLKQEQDDGLEIIAWIARQPWCTGSIGLTGYSWGGFSALQLAARQPPALKAIIAHCFTDDRYTDDAHYMGGALLQDMFMWGSDFYTLQALPPDPDVVGPRWRDMWRARCESIEFVVANWMRHQTRDAYWKHASIDENYADVQCPVYAMGGIADAYVNAVPRVMAHLTTPRKALIGPWSHNWPNTATPGPNIDFLNEALRWWDHWLKGIQNGVMDEPAFRAWMMDDAPHAGAAEAPGRWVAEDAWPSPRIVPKVLYLNRDGLHPVAGDQGAVVLAPDHQSVGVTAGRWCPDASGVSGEDQVQLPLDQQIDDARSMTFDTAPLSDDLEILGFPIVELDLSVDQPVALVAVRLDDLQPGGTSRRVSYGVLNLTHRDSHEHPTPLEPGQRYTVRVELKAAAYAFRRGHRLRIAISTSYWPLVWPSPAPVTLTLHGASSLLILPTRPLRAADAHLRSLGRAFTAPDSGITEVKAGPAPSLVATWDVGRATHTIISQSESGSARFDAIGTVVSGGWRETTTIKDQEPTTATTSISQYQEYFRGEWRVRIESTIDVSVSFNSYHLKGSLRTFDNGKLFFSRDWDEYIPRFLS